SRRPRSRRVESSARRPRSRSRLTSWVSKDPWRTVLRRAYNPSDAENLMAAQPARLCIISREPLRSMHFIAALQASLGPEDRLEIIVDRRQGGVPGKADLTEDRRRQRQVAL